MNETKHTPNSHNLDVHYFGICKVCGGTKIEAADAEGLSVPAISLRDHFAGLAMQGICARTNENDTYYTTNGVWIHPGTVAQSAYELAAAMLEERKNHVSTPIENP